MRKQRVVDDRDEPPHEKEARKQSKRPSVADSGLLRVFGGIAGRRDKCGHDYPLDRVRMNSFANRLAPFHLSDYIAVQVPSMGRDVSTGGLERSDRKSTRLNSSH